MECCLVSDGINVYLRSVFSRGFCCVCFLFPYCCNATVYNFIYLYCLLQTTIDLTFHCAHKIIGFFKVFRFYLLLLVENHAYYQFIWRNIKLKNPGFFFLYNLPFTGFLWCMSVHICDIKAKNYKNVFC